MTGIVPMTFRIPLDVAVSLGMLPWGSRNSWVVQAIREKLEREKKPKKGDA